jgi:nucleoside-diphosphate-sugar epimerase
VPLTIPRLNWSYGLGGNGGMPVSLMRRLALGESVPVHPDWEFVGSPIHEDDLAAHVEGFLNGATVGGTVVNWAGDEAVSVEQLVPWLAEEMGVSYSFTEMREVTAYPRATDNTRRQALVGECRVPWREGFRRVLADRFPELVGAAQDQQTTEDVR